MDLDRDFFAHFLLVFLLVFWHDIISNFVPVFGSCTFFCRVLLPERSSPERRRRRSPERRSMVEERREDEMKRGGEDQPYIRHTNGAPRAGAPLVIFFIF